jgi:hypothetical protein
VLDGSSSKVLEQFGAKIQIGNPDIIDSEIDTCVFEIIGATGAADAVKELADRARRQRAEKA